jgi:hypothetical protein
MPPAELSLSASPLVHKRTCRARFTRLEYRLNSPTRLAGKQTPTRYPKGRHRAWGRAAFATPAGNPDRFVAFATAALQFPDLAADQIEHAVRKLGFRGVGIGGNVGGMEISDPALNAFWAKAESLGILVFIHPQGDGAPSQLGHRFHGNGYLSNVIGNPLETTIALSHLIFRRRPRSARRTAAAFCPPMPPARTLRDCYQRHQ